MASFKSMLKSHLFDHTVKPMCC